LLELNTHRFWLADRSPVPTMRPKATSPRPVMRALFEAACADETGIPAASKPMSRVTIRKFPDFMVNGMLRRG
jgi:hypothetical protein